MPAASGQKVMQYRQLLLMLCAVQGLDQGLPPSSSASAQAHAFTTASPVAVSGLPQGFPDFAARLPRPQLPQLPQPMASDLMASAGRRLHQVGSRLSFPNRC